MLFEFTGRMVLKNVNHVFANQRAHGVVVSHPLRMRKALGSNPSASIFSQGFVSLLVCAYVRGTRG